MKGWLFVPVALVAGIALGGWAPRLEARRLKNELALARHTSRDTGTQVLGTLSQVMKIPSAPSARATPETTSPSPAADGLDTAAAPDRTPSDMGAESDFGSRLEQAKELWRTRSELVRNTFAASTALNADQLARFDTLVAAMNLRIKTSIQSFAEQLRSQENLTPEDGIRLVNELSGHLVQAYGDLDQSMPPSWRAGSGGGLNISDLIDPSVAEPLVGLESRMDAMRGHRPPWQRPHHNGPAPEATEP